MRSFSRFIASVAACASLSLCAPASAAPGSPRSFVELNGSGADTTQPSQPPRRGAHALASPATCGGPGYAVYGSSPITLTAGYSSYGIYNPSTDAYDQVNVRAYNGCPYGL